MPLLAEYNLDHLHRILTASKWLLVICGVIFLFLAILNQWLAARISSLQEKEKMETEQQLRLSQGDLAQANAKVAATTAELARFTAPRRLTEEQIASLRKCLQDGPRGKVVMAYLKVEPDAEAYANQIGRLLSEAGFTVTLSKTVWLQLAVKGMYLCARDASDAPTHAVHIQRCFQLAGLRLRANEDKKMYSDMAVPDDTIIFVVSGRE